MHVIQTLLTVIAKKKNYIITGYASQENQNDFREEANAEVLL
jgi:hypothetical protein